jgi:dipeptidyl-peptidase-2
MAAAPTVFAVALVLLAQGVGAEREEVWFDSAIDHYDMQSTATFRQRCLVDASALRSDGASDPTTPVLFFYAGNEGPIEEFASSAGLLDELAPRFGALVAFCEHRYYGKSLPFGPGAGPGGSFAREHVGKLSVEQTLADYALLIPRLIGRYGLDVPSATAVRTIAFGGSYGGMLSAWMRMRYPGLIDGALAASAPLRLPVGGAASPGFYEAVSNDLAAADPACPARVRAAFTELLELARPDDATAAGARGRAALARRLRLCGGVLEQSSVGHLVAWARNAFVVIGMCDYPYPATFLAPLPAWPVDAACRLLRAAPSALDGLAAVGALVYNASAEAGSLGAHVRATSRARSALGARRAGGGGAAAGAAAAAAVGGGAKARQPPQQAQQPAAVQQCFDLASEYVECADQTGCGLGDAARAWDYQACTEVAILVSTDNVTDPFPPHRCVRALSRPRSRALLRLVWVSLCVALQSLTTLSLSRSLFLSVSLSPLSFALELSLSSEPPPPINCHHTRHSTALRPLPVTVSRTTGRARRCVAPSHCAHRWGEAELAAYCLKTWGVRPRLDWAQASFGGTAADPARGFRAGPGRIAFSNGLLDPWHGGGFLEGVGAKAQGMPAILLPKGAHHLDLRASDARDPAGTAEAREREAALIKSWLLAPAE